MVRWMVVVVMQDRCENATALVPQRVQVLWWAALLLRLLSELGQQLVVEAVVIGAVDAEPKVFEAQRVGTELGWRMAGWISWQVLVI